MKKALLLLVEVFIAMNTFGQTQYGYIKTKGRLSNNGIVIAGLRLPGTIVQARGANAVLSGNDGTFSLPVLGGKYYLQNVQKKGYVLIDPDVLLKQYIYSKNPLVLVLETASQQEDDKLAAIRKIRRTLEQQLQKKDEEIQVLKEQNKLSEEAYRQLLQELYAQQESNEKLINEMAERYSKIDFDEEDEFNNRISYLILNGQLTEADSLLNSKGDINKRIAQIHRNQEAIAMEEEELEKKKEKLEETKFLTQKDIENVAKACYSKFTICKLKHENDSAAYYIEARANLDPQNVEWQLDAGDFFFAYMADYERALMIYQSCLEKIDKESDVEKCIEINWNISNVYREKAMYKEAIDLIKNNIEIEKQHFGDNSHYLVISTIDLGMIYSEIEEYKMSQDYYEEALKNTSCLLNDSIRIFINSGSNHIKNDNNNEGYLCYEKALNLIKNHPDLNLDTHEAACYNGLSNAYQNNDQFEKAIEYSKKSIEIEQKTFGEKHPNIAREYTNLGFIYNRLGKYNEALSMLFKAVEIDSLSVGVWHPSLAHDYNNIGYSYQNLGEYEKSLSYYERALKINTDFYGKNNSSTATNLVNIGMVYSNLKEFDKALSYYKEAKESFVNIFGEINSNLSTCYSDMADIYIETGQYEEAEKILNKALKIDLKIKGENSTQTAVTYNNFGRLYNKKGDYEESAKYMQKAISILIGAFGEEHPHVAISYYNVGVLYKKKGDYRKALELTNKALDIMSKILPNTHPTILKFQEGKNEIENLLHNQQTNKIDK